MKSRRRSPRPAATWTRHTAGERQVCGQASPWVTEGGGGGARSPPALPSPSRGAGHRQRPAAAGCGGRARACGEPRRGAAGAAGESSPRRENRLGLPFRQLLGQVIGRENERKALVNLRTGRRPLPSGNSVNFKWWWLMIKNPFKLAKSHHSAETSRAKIPPPPPPPPG